jgi:hypothetical protein
MFDRVKRAMHRHNDGTWEEMQPADESSSHVVDDPERAWLKEGVVYKCPCGDSFFVQHDAHGSNDLLAIPRA